MILLSATVFFVVKPTWKGDTVTKASDLYIEALEAEGVEYIFGIPGEENLDFLDSLSRSKKIKLILTRQ